MNEAFLGLNPLYWTYLKVCINDVLNVRHSPGHKYLYTFEKHAIRNVEIYGVVVAIDQSHAVTTFTVDDGSGTVSCVKWKDSVSTETSIVLGKGVRILGRLSEFKGKMQITIHDISIVHDPNRELLHIIEAMVLRRDIYKKPYDIPSEIADSSEKLSEQLLKGGADVYTSSQVSQKPDDTDEESFCKALLTYLRENCAEGPFSYNTQAREDNSLKNFARRVLLAKNRAEPSHMEITKLFAKCMMEFERKGHIIEKTKYGSQMYCLLQTKDLVAAIKKIIVDSSQNLTFEHGGVLQEFIVTRIQDQTMYSKLPRSKIVECLDEMIKSSILYNTGKREYKLVA